jgi:hypothetical protein
VVIQAFTECWWEILICSYNGSYTDEPLITDTAGEFQFCPLQGVFISWGSSSDYLSPAELLSGRLYSSLSLSQIALDNRSAPATSVSLAEPVWYYEWELLTGQENTVCWTVHIHVFEK